ncbi:MAG: hypothetical protein U1E86_28220 [Burkholderiaceae bacterium]
MSVSGPNANPFRLPGAATYARPVAPKATPTAQASSARPAAEPGATAAAQETSLWDLLTAEERDFFQQAAELGSITYRPSRASAAPLAAAPVGQRLDVRG